MKNNKYISLMCLISLSLGTSAWSQGPGGHGPNPRGPGPQGPAQPGGPAPGQGGGGAWGGPGGHPFGGQNPGVPILNQPVFSTNCGQQYSQPAQSALLTACVAGGQAAMETAQRMATQQGRNDGFRTGYAWGLRNGIDSTSSDPTQVAAGAAALNATTSPAMLQTLDADADQAGTSAGTSQGTPSGSQEAISRFQAAIDTGSMPSQTVSSSDYAKYNPQYTSPYNNAYAQTIGPIQSELDILNSGTINPGQVTFYSNGYDSGILGNAPNFNPADFYTPDGRYGFDRNQELDGGNAFDRFASGGGFDTSVYNTLGTVQIITGYTTPPAADPVAPVAAPVVAHIAAPASPKPGTPPAGGGQGSGTGGQPGHGGSGPSGPSGPGSTPTPAPKPAPTATPVPAPTATPAPAPVATPTPAPFVPQPIYTTYNLKQIFQDSFVQSYNEVAGYYYNNAFNSVLNDGTNGGYYVGAQVGEKLAYQSGLVNAYNSQFSQREGNAFVLAYDNSFNASFSSEYNTYATNPEIGVDSFSVVGIHNDGIVEPGEAITASYVVRNYGGVDATLPVSMSGDVTGAQQATLVFPKLSTSRQSGSLSATMSATLASQSNANILLNVGSNQVPLTQYVTNQVIASASSYTVDMPHGNATVTFPLQNVSTDNSYDAMSVIVTDSIGRSETLPIGFLAGGQTWSAPINLNGYNPLDMIDGKISVQLQALLGTVVVGSGSLTFAPNDTANHLIAQAFEAAAMGSNTGLQSQISSRIYSTIMTEALAEGRGSYQNDTSSLIYALVQFKKSHPQNPTTLAAYKALSNSLKPVDAAIHKQHGGLFGSGTDNQKYFEAQMAALNSN